MQSTKLNYANSQYPRLLREISSPPRVLYVAGQLREMPLVAIVGTRRPTSYGEEVTGRLASELAAAGLGIVSGLAIGVDTAAHRAALEAGGYTIAVLGSGLNQVQPARNRGLAAKIVAAGGAVITEYEPDMPGLKQNFPARNRIIAGLCLGVVVTEAGEKSGAAITAHAAREQNREVMAVPGNITSLMSAGTNKLLQAGATAAVTSAQEVLNVLNLQSSALPAKPVTPASREEATIMRLLDQGVTSSQELIDRSGFSASRFAQVISLMEITGKVRGLGAGIWVRR